MLAREDGIARVAQQQGRIVRAFDVDQRGFRSSHDRPSRLFRYLKRVHFEQCHQERQGGFRSLILIGAVGMQTVPAPARGRIVERKLKIVVSQEPVERGPGIYAPAIVARDPVSL